VATHVWLQLGVTVILCHSLIIEQAGGNFFAD
jgi:hypothetical protein